MRSTLVWSTLVFAFCALLSSSDGQLRFANYYGDHMVLQRAPQKAVVWGYGAANARTILRMNNKVYRTRSSPPNAVGDSIWSVTLDPQTGEGPYEILVTQPVANGSLVTIALNDVLYGDVWICSGQSNMQMAIIDNFNASEEIAKAANYPKIRLFTASLKSSSTPVEELLGITQRWSVGGSSSVGGPSYQYASATCWQFGRRIHDGLNGRPLGLIATSWGGTAIEVWMPPQALQDCGLDKKGTVALEPYGQHNFQELSLVNSDLWNAMIYPFTRMSIFGAIWYQGESNAGTNRDKYTCTFSKMIEYWRSGWYTRSGGNTNPTFPFGFVQLSTSTTNMAYVGGFPWIRWHQTFDVGHVPNAVVPNVFMGAAMDLRDDPGGIHPRTKSDVGYRLARAGLAVAYGQSIEFQGPIVQTVTVAGDSSSVEVVFGSVTSIELRSPDGFEVCCQGASCTNDNLWVATPASAKSIVSITLTVPAACTSKPLYGLRYLWRETPCFFKMAAVYSGTDSNLPLAPYIKLF